MENNAAVDIRQCGDSNLVSKSIDSSVKIDSISIDLISTASEKSDAEKCDHFSIRGFVSEIRKKDWKMCWPFASDGDGNKYNGAHDLPSLHVPKFRYWRCYKCVLEICPKDVGNEYGSILKSCNNGFKPNGTCSHVSNVGDIVKIVSNNFQQNPKLDVLKEKDFDSENASARSNYITGEQQPQVAHDPTGGNNSGDNLNQEAHRLMTDIFSQKEKINEVSATEDHKSKFKSNESIDVFDPDGVHEAADAELIRNVNCVDEISARSHEIGEVNYIDDRPKELAREMSGEAGIIEEACSAGTGSTHPSLEKDDCDYNSSESAEIIAGSKVRVHENSNGLHRKRTRKVRLLTELLSGNGDVNMDNMKNDDSLSNAIHAAAVESEKLQVSEGHTDLLGNSRKAASQHRKRKADWDEDWRPVETGSPIKADNEFQVFQKDAESSDISLQAFSKIQSQTDRKSNSFKRKIDKNQNVGKKSKKTGNTSNSDAADKLMLQATHNSNTGEEADVLPLSAQIMGKRPSLKKKGKMPEDNFLQAPLCPQNNGMLKEDPMSRKNVEFQRTMLSTDPLHATHDTFTENGLDLSLNSYLTTQRYSIQPTPPLENGLPFVLTGKGDIAKESHVSRKASEIQHLGNFNFAYRSGPDTPFVKAVYSDLCDKRAPSKLPFFNEKYTSPVENGGCSHIPDQNFNKASGKKKAIEIQELSSVTRKDGDRRAKKVSEQVTSDDIPMEIVELMAKHQYERCLPDSEYDRFQLGASNNTRSHQTMDFSKAYMNEEMSLFQQEATQRQNSRAKSGRNGTTKNVGPSKQKPVDYFSQTNVNQLNMGQPKHIPTTARIGAYFQHHQKPSSEIQHYASSSGGQNSAENSKWIAEFAGKRATHHCLQTSGTCNTCQGIPQQSKETNHIWSTMMPNHMPFIYDKRSGIPNIINVVSNSPVNLNKENVNGHHDLKCLNQNAASFGKQKQNFGSDILRTSVEPFASKHNGIDLSQKPMGSFDLYSNETIPAMHLLSLMDAGLQSSNIDAAPKFLKKAPATHNQDSKEFLRLESLANKVTNTHKHAPYGSHGKNQVAEDSHGCMSTIPAVVGPSTSSFPNDKFFKKSSDMTFHVAGEKGTESRPQSSDYRSQKSASSSRNLGTNCGSIPVHSMQTMIFGASDSMLFPLPFRGLENLNKRKLEIPRGPRPVPFYRTTSDGICSTNRNPADFSIPGPGNDYMISGKDLKFGDTTLANGYASNKVVGQKRQKKPSAMKENQRHFIS